MPNQLYRFKNHVFEPPMKPYYDAYYGHTFMISHHHPEDQNGGHVWLNCISDPKVQVQGYVHICDLERL